MDPAVKDKWTCTLGGGVDTGDVARLTLDGVNFDTECSPALNTLASRAAEIATSAMQGTWDTWKLTISGGNAAGTETLTVQIPGDTGGDGGTDTWHYSPPAGRTNAEMAGDLRTALATSTTYNVSGASTFVSLKRKVRGAGVTIVSTADGALSTGQTHTVTGVAGQAAWTVTDNGVSAVICERATAGATAGTVASSYSTDAGAASTFTAVHTTTGADADVLAVSDGTTTFSHTVTSAVLADQVAALAALIDASASYTASALAGTITVDAPEGASAFAFVNASTDHQTADLTCTITTVISSGGGTGIRTVRVQYLDGNGVRQHEDLSLNGTTPVLSVALDVKAILSLTALTVGSGGSAAGTITVKNVAATSTFDQIPAGATQGQAACYRVPAGRNAYVVELLVASALAGTTVRLKSDANPVSGQVVSGAAFDWMVTLAGTTPESVEQFVPVGPFPAGANVWLTGHNAAESVLVGALQGYLEPA